MTISSTSRAVGTSPKISFTAENFGRVDYLKITPIDINGVHPPDIATGAAFSHAMNMWIQTMSFWNFSKITEPKFDGIAGKTGVISNHPDFIKDYHMIGLMRNVDLYLKPEFRSHIFVSTTMPTPLTPPTP